MTKKTGEESTMPRKPLYSNADGLRSLADRPVHYHHRRECLWKAIQSLPDRLSEVVQLRYFGENGSLWTLAQIGSHLGVSDERVRQLLKEANKFLLPKYESLLIHVE